MSAFGRVLGTVVGHEQQIEVLVTKAKDSKLSHCVLLHGKSGVGKRLIAWGLAQEILCDSPKDGNACGFCPHCSKIQNHHHEAILEILPKNNRINVDEAKKVLEFVQLAKIGKARFVIIDGVEKMNPQTANSLLKNLEEPAAGTFYFLITSSLKSVLQTIRSRSMQIQFSPLSGEQMRRVMPSAEDWMLEAGNGSVEKLKSLYSDEEKELRSNVCNLFNHLSSEHGYVKLLELIQTLSKSSKEEFLRALAEIQNFIRDCLMVKKGYSAKFYQDQMELIEKCAILPEAHLFFFLQNCIEKEQELHLNTDQSLILESLFLKFEKAYQNRKN
ncbi:MAG: ATP-binding protein [Bdellovibrionales bacterium]